MIEIIQGNITRCELIEGRKERGENGYYTSASLTTRQKENILIGDVWIAGGQSNMQFRLAAVDDGDLEVASANFPQIRLLTIPKIFGPELKTSFPRSEAFSKLSGSTTTDGDWQVCSPETVANFSAIGYVMARRIHMVTGIPIGVINTSRGGTLVEAWTPEERLRKMEAPEAKEMLLRYDEKVATYDPKADLERQIKKYESRIADMEKQGKTIPAGMKPPTKPSPGPLYSHNRPGNCYASVISPIAGFAVKGVIFHQGYNNCFDGVRGSSMYRAVFPEMIRGWREAFKIDEIRVATTFKEVTGEVLSAPGTLLAVH